MTTMAVGAGAACKQKSVQACPEVSKCPPWLWALVLLASKRPTAKRRPRKRARKAHERVRNDPVDTGQLLRALRVRA